MKGEDKQNRMLALDRVSRAVSRRAYHRAINPLRPELQCKSSFSRHEFSGKFPGRFVSLIVCDAGLPTSYCNLPINIRVYQSRRFSVAKAGNRAGSIFANTFQGFQVFERIWNLPSVIFLELTSNRMRTHY